MISFFESRGPSVRLCTKKVFFLFFKGRLNEILSQISVQPGSYLGASNGKLLDQTRYNLDTEAEKDLHQFLSWEQDAIKELVDILKKDMELANNLILQETK